MVDGDDGMFVQYFHVITMSTLGTNLGEETEEDELMAAYPALDPFDLEAPGPEDFEALEMQANRPLGKEHLMIDQIRRGCTWLTYCELGGMAGRSGGAGRFAARLLRRVRRLPAEMDGDRYTLDWIDRTDGADAAFGKCTYGVASGY